LNSVLMDLRDFVPSPSQSTGFVVFVSRHTAALRLHPDKAQLRDMLLTLRATGLSYREIAYLVGLHWTRVAQILREKDKLPRHQPD
jgi:hypothetical protein